MLLYIVKSSYNWTQTSMLSETSHRKLVGNIFLPNTSSIAFALFHILGIPAERSSKLKYLDESAFPS